MADTAPVRPRVFVYPAITDAERAGDLLMRLSWYMAPHLGAVDTIVLSVTDPTWFEVGDIPRHIDPAVAALIPREMRSCFMTHASKKRLRPP